MHCDLTSCEMVTVVWEKSEDEDGLDMRIVRRAELETRFIRECGTFASNECPILMLLAMRDRDA